MDKGGEAIKPSQKVNRRSFLLSTLGTAAAIVVGGAAGVGQAGVVEAPSAPRPQAAKPPVPPEQVILGGSIIEAPLVGQRVGSDQKPSTFEGPRSKTNDHAQWGIKIDDSKSVNKPQSTQASIQHSTAASDPPSEFEEQAVGMSYDEVRALPNDDPMKEELLKKFAQQPTKKS